MQDLDSLLSLNKVKTAFASYNLTLAPGARKVLMLKVKGIKEGAECLSLHEFDKVKGLSISAGLDSVINGYYINVERANSLSNLIVLRKGKEQK